jgi:hypothetical protein
MRHHSRGPTKKLAPAVSPETACPHEYREDEGLQLEIDCMDCPGANDLTNNRCLSGILNIISRSARPDAIVLKRFMEKRYRGAELEWIGWLAHELAVYTRAMNSTDRPSDRRCRTCPASKDRVLPTMKRMLLEDPRGYRARWSAMADDLRSNCRSVSCAESQKCLDETLCIVNLSGGI